MVGVVSLFPKSSLENLIASGRLAPTFVVAMSIVTDPQPFKSGYILPIQPKTTMTYKSISSDEKRRKLEALDQTIGAYSGTLNDRELHEILRRLHPPKPESPRSPKEHVILSPKEKKSTVRPGICWCLYPVAILLAGVIFLNIFITAVCQVTDWCKIRPTPQSGEGYAALWKDYAHPNASFSSSPSPSLSKSWALFQDFHYATAIGSLEKFKAKKSELAHTLTVGNFEVTQLIHILSHKSSSSENEAQAYTSLSTFIAKSEALITNAKETIRQMANDLRTLHKAGATEPLLKDEVKDKFLYITQSVPAQLELVGFWAKTARLDLERLQATLEQVAKLHHTRPGQKVNPDELRERKFWIGLLKKHDDRFKKASFGRMACVASKTYTRISNAIPSFTSVEKEMDDLKTEVKIFREGLERRKLKFEKDKPVLPYLVVLEKSAKALKEAGKEAKGLEKKSTEVMLELGECRK
ncbi:hypothetical protein P154DRAFT_531077 [Amniculicola lignicola CBS 123094]|uniref:Uncharacterized protein n=1 Tax=Amniculicola lignicola CBS 123094 TaxID=1392246 RepID=A0A6A5WST4_9PLEO|nr:hypothetical protein P154DRAFT_531077 [Amniculicola lignicola CBS 123094]